MSTDEIRVCQCDETIKQEKWLCFWASDDPAEGVVVSAKDWFTAAGLGRKVLLEKEPNHWPTDDGMYCVRITDRR